MLIRIAPIEVSSSLNLVKTLVSLIPGGAKGELKALQRVADDYTALLNARSPEHADELRDAFEAEFVREEPGPIQAWIDSETNGLVIDVNPEYIADINEVITEELPFIAGLVTTIAGAVMMFKCRFKTFEKRVNEVIAKYCPKPKVEVSEEEQAAE